MPNIDLSLNPTGTPPTDTQEQQIRDALGIDRALNVVDPTTDGGVAAAVGTQGYTTDSPPRHFKKFGTGATDWVQLPDQTDLDASLALKADQTGLDASLALKVDQTDLDASLALKADHIELDVLDPSSSGVEATISTIGTATDNTQWVKVGELNTDWRQFLTSEADGTYSANIKLPDVSAGVPLENVLGVRNGKVTLGNGEDAGGIPINTDTVGLQLQMAPFVHTLNRDQWRKSVRFTAPSRVFFPISVKVKSTTGYAVILNHDGTWGQTGNNFPSSGNKVGDGNSANEITVISKTPPTDNKPSFYAIVPCDINGIVSGELTEIVFNLGSMQITNLDGTSLGALTNIQIVSNYLTFFDSAGLGALTNLNFDNNQLISFNGTELGELTNLDLANNNLPSFVGTGLGKVAVLNLDNNQLVSFAGLGLSLATVIIVSNNQITSFDGTGLDALDILNLDNNQLTNFDGTTLDTLTGIAIRNNQLDSIIMAGQDLSFRIPGNTGGSNVGQNNLDLAALIAFLESLGTTTTGVILYGGNPGSSAFETYLATADGKGYIWLNN